MLPADTMTHFCTINISKQKCCCQATKTTPQPIDGDLRIFLSHLSNMDGWRLCGWRPATGLLVAQFSDYFWFPVHFIVHAQIKMHFKLVDELNRRLFITYLQLNVNICNHNSVDMPLFVSVSASFSVSTSVFFCSLTLTHLPIFHTIGYLSASTSHLFTLPPFPIFFAVSRPFPYPLPDLS